MDAQDTGDSVCGEKDRCLPQKDSRLNLGSKRGNTVKRIDPLLSESVALLANSDAQRASSDESRVARYCEQTLQNVLEDGRNCQLLEGRLMTL